MFHLQRVLNFEIADKGLAVDDDDDHDLNSYTVWTVDGISPCYSALRSFPPSLPPTLSFFPSFFSSFLFFFFLFLSLLTSLRLGERQPCTAFKDSGFQVSQTFGHILLLLLAACLAIVPYHSQCYFPEMIVTCTYSSSVLFCEDTRR